LNRSVGRIENEVTTVSAALQAEKQSTLSEFQKVNLVVSHIEAKITGGLATQTQSVGCTTPHHTSLVRAEDISQSNSNTTVSSHSHSENSRNASVSGVNTCNASACNVRVKNVSVISCNNNVKAGSGLYANNTDLSKLSSDIHGQYKYRTPSFLPGPRPILLPEKNAQETKISFGFRSSKRTVRQTMVGECF